MSIHLNTGAGSTTKKDVGGEISVSFCTVSDTSVTLNACLSNDLLESPLLEIPISSMQNPGMLKREGEGEGEGEKDGKIVSNLITSTSSNEIVDLRFQNPEEYII